MREGYGRWSVLYDHDANPLPALEEPVVRRLVGDARGAPGARPVGSLDHPMGDMVLSVLRARLHPEELVELAPDAAFADDYLRAEKYVGWPMLVVVALGEADSGA